MKSRHIFSNLLWILIFLTQTAPCFSENTKTVLLAILARDKEISLPRYLDCIDKLDYDKKSIVVYINTNNNTDNTQSILENWIKKHKNDYKYIDYEPHTVSKFSGSKKFQAIAKIYDKSLNKTLDYKCDYYFVVDCDSFIIPETLKILLSKNKPIVAPILYSIPNMYDVYSNYFAAIDENGYYRDDPLYYSIFYMNKKGTFKVPVVHSTYLVNAQYIDDLKYYDKSNDYPFIVFSKNARKNYIDQYICNDLPFGEIIHFITTPSLEEKMELLGPFTWVD